MGPRIGTWNVRGLGSDVKKSAVRALIRSQRLDMIFIQESKLVAPVDSLFHVLWGSDEGVGVFSESVGQSGGLITVWNKNVFHGDMLFRNRYVLIVKGTWVRENIVSVMCNVYAPASISNKKELWELLSDWLEGENIAWCLGGDFNAVLSEEDWSGDRAIRGDTRDFIDFVDSGHWWRH